MRRRARVSVLIILIRRFALAVAMTTSTVLGANPQLSAGSVARMQATGDWPRGIELPLERQQQLIES